MGEVQVNRFLGPTTLYHEQKNYSLSTFQQKYIASISIDDTMYRWDTLYTRIIVKTVHVKLFLPINIFEHFWEKKWTETCEKKTINKI